MDNEQVPDNTTSGHEDQRDQEEPNTEQDEFEDECMDDNWDDWDWNEGIPDNPSEFTIPMDILILPTPKGLGLDSEAKEWLQELDIYNWNDLVQLSCGFEVVDLMIRFGIRIYFERKNTYRRLILLGQLCGLHTRNKTPTPETIGSWMSHYTNLINGKLRQFPLIEKAACRHIQIHLKGKDLKSPGTEMYEEYSVLEELDEPANASANACEAMYQINIQLMKMPSFNMILFTYTKIWIRRKRRRRKKGRRRRKRREILQGIIVITFQMTHLIHHPLLVLQVQVPRIHRTTAMIWIT